MSSIVCVVDNEAEQKSDLEAEHGLSFWITMADGNVLFDTGQSVEVLRNNLEKLQLNIGELNALVLSHAHFDHTGGLEAILTQKDALPIYAHKNLFTERFAEINGQERNVGLSDENVDLLKSHNLFLDDNPVEVLPGLWTTGSIKEKSEPLGSSPFLYVLHEGERKPDPYEDDISLVIKMNKGLIILCGCCHAGLLNTLTHVGNIFSEPIAAVLGGAHLVYSENDYLDHVIDIISTSYGQTKFYLNHCTGENAIQRFKDILGDQVEYFYAGSKVSFID